MLGVDHRTVRVAWTLLLLFLAVAAIYLARKTVLIFLFALFFAYMLSPLVEMLNRYLPKRFSRMWAVAAVYAVFLTVVITAAVTIGSRIAEEATLLAQKMPELLKNAQNWSQNLIPVTWEPLRTKLIGTVQSVVEMGSEQIVPFAKQAGVGVLAIAGNLLYVVLIPILSLLFLKDGEEIRDVLITMQTGEDRRRVLEEILGDLHILLGQYIRAIVLLALATFGFYSIVFLSLSVPYAVLLAGIAAVLEFIPVVGPLSASVIAILVAAVSGYPHVLWLVLFLLVYRLFQDYVLSPYLMSSGVELHPLLVLFGVLAGEQIGGIPGMFFSVPLIAALRVVYLRLRRGKFREDVSRE